MKKLNRWLAVCGCALLGVGSALAGDKPLGVVDAFSSLDSALQITVTIEQVIICLSLILGVGLSLNVIRMVYRLVYRMLTEDL